MHCLSITAVLFAALASCQMAQPAQPAQVVKRADATTICTGTLKTPPPKSNVCSGTGKIRRSSDYIRHFTHQSFEACRDHCLSLEECKSFTYAKKSLGETPAGDCHMYDEVINKLGYHKKPREKFVPKYNRECFSSSCTTIFPSPTSTPPSSSTPAPPSCTLTSGPSPSDNVVLNPSFDEFCDTQGYPWNFGGEASAVKGDSTNNYAPVEGEYVVELKKTGVQSVPGLYGGAIYQEFPTLAAAGGTFHLEYYYRLVSYDAQGSSGIKCILSSELFNQYTAPPGQPKYIELSPGMVSAGWLKYSSTFTTEPDFFDDLLLQLQCPRDASATVIVDSVYLRKE